ncbi:MAG: carbamoyl phosphate synthase large subunit [Clostridiales bacterium]|nr:MAG: carbamoyl phosphate synthase large subunit [Clostridiales bacterium]
MPLDPAIKKVLVIGSGPIVIGQAAEFDYAGTQACRALKEEGLQVVLCNSNPATIMTDREMADEIYLEPLTVETVKRIILKERPDSLLSTLGGQTGLTLSMQLAKEGFLEAQGVRLLGARVETIDRAEDRQLFRDTMLSIGEPVIPSEVAHDLEHALRIAGEIGYPVIVRPAFTMGGSGGGIAQDPEQLGEIAQNGLRLSPISQVLVEKCVSGWKEIEFEVMRDRSGSVITVCSMENFDPVGVHTGDSIVIAPAVTLADKEYQMLRSAALHIISALGVEGGCNCQFALHPESMEYAVIEVNPRVSRSSALASKATGYPIAKVAAKIAIGYNLDEIQNAVTGKTCACFEPALDYVVVKFPKWPFDKFVYADRRLGTQMKATGEVMAIAHTFEAALMKAVRGAEISLDCLIEPKLQAVPDHELFARVSVCSDERLFVVCECMRRGMSCGEIHARTKIDLWFLYKLQNLLEMERRLQNEAPTPALYRAAKELGFPDRVIERLSGKRVERPLAASFKMVDTCAAEFEAQTPYFYSTYDEVNEAAQYLQEHKSRGKTVVVLGSGPIRIGQGIEFDYASVQCAWTLKKQGYEVVIINNNPETVSTDFDTADRLYFEPLTPEDVMNVIRTERPYGVVAAFGGQTAIKLTRFLHEQGIRILGTSADSVDMAEDRERFDALLESLSIARPKGAAVTTAEQALAAAHELQYPVLLRPSYVLGGQNMIIAFSDDDVREYMQIILSHGIESPVLIDQYLTGTELEADAICDGEEVLIPGIMEHIERAGVHSGDSIAVYPAYNLSAQLLQRVVEYTERLALSLRTKGLINIQYVVHQGEIYVIEVNPRASRTVPYISKVTGVPMTELATRAMLGERLRAMGFGTGLRRTPPYVAVKVPVFSFEKLADVDVLLGPEMKSTGEVLGIGKTLDEALYKGLIAAGYRMEKGGGVLLTVRERDKDELPKTARGFARLGFALYATEGTAAALKRAGIAARTVKKIHEAEENVLSLLESGKIQYIVSTSEKGRIPTRDSVRIRRKAVERSIPCLTSLDTANALLHSLWGRFTEANTELVDINHMRGERLQLHFTKMQACGNDYIYFDCFRQEVASPEALSVRLSERRTGIGGDGIVLILPSESAHARMRMFNADGSEGRMCGNAIRCVGKYLYDSGIVREKTVKVETLSGIRTLVLHTDGGQVRSVRVDMGPAVFLPEQVPVKIKGERVVDCPIRIGEREYRVTCLSMGNPHCVVFTADPAAIDLAAVGPSFEHDSIFPDRVNTEFVSVPERNVLRMRVWERGSGETFACGTGACASAAAAVAQGLCDKDEDILVHLLGGDLTIRVTDETVYMTGEAVKVYEGAVEL